MNSVLVLFVLVSATSFLAAANYICVCNRDTDVRSQVFDSVLSPIGYLNPNNCTPSLSNSSSDERWLSIQFNQKVAYIKEEENLVIDECIGTVSTIDTDPTRMPVTYTMFVPSSYTSPPATSAPTTSHITTISPALLGNKLLCPPYVIKGAKANGYLLTQNHKACYEVCQDKVSWAHAHMLCTERGGHLVTIHNFHENAYLNQVVLQGFNHRVWIGLHDRVHEEHFEWATGEKLTYMNWKLNHRKSANHTHEDCVMMLKNGSWDDVECGGNNPATEDAHTTHGYVCEYQTHDSGAFIVG